ncbi:PREDICTED: glutamic acid-rich protein [Camelina sativa]|uniref:Glutamic acid-rich protein n=1 Tax=Camelina sativa TaxID=90675 RepID=A0ABM0UV84_CAMSA|nr:PREDICTED: glutamic acid-rich protein [Camelina sativa]
MSRCFPFPPPGYVLNGIRDEAMIVSIKGAEEKAKKEQRRKDKKRDKKEKKDKKDKKEKEKKRKDRDGKEGESEKHSHKRRRTEEGAKVDLFRKLKESEINCLEKSSLTVERELLQSTSQNSCDSTLNSNEILQPLDGGRHNNDSKQQPLDGGRHNNNDSESIIRIRLPIRRQKDPDVMTTNKDQDTPCSSRGIKLESSQLAASREPVNHQHPCSTSAPEHASKPREEKSKDPVLKGKHHGKEKKKAETYQLTRSRCSCPPSVVSQFLNVVENWVPNTIETRVDLINSEDEECWWSMKKPSIPTERCIQLDRNNEITQVGNSMGWPCARLLPEADVYALPYTVPF